MSMPLAPAGTRAHATRREGVGERIISEPAASGNPLDFSRDLAGGKTLQVREAERVGPSAIAARIDVRGDDGILVRSGSVLFGDAEGEYIARKQLNLSTEVMAGIEAELRQRLGVSLDATGSVGTLIADVAPERVSWLWPGRIPYGKLTVLDGDPGLGKSVATLDLAARLSVGAPLPDGPSTEAAGVVLASAEDGLADTIAPRLIAAGADLGRILALSEIPDDNGDPRPLGIPDDLPVIEAAIARVGARLLVVDPLMAFLDERVNTDRDHGVRRALHRLAALAERTGCAILVVRHLNKAPGGNPLYRGGGSIGIIGAARSGLLVAPDPEDEGLRVLASTKSNLGPPPPALAYRVEGTASGAARVAWVGVSQHTARSLLAAPQDDEERGALAQAAAFLRDLLADGPRAATECECEAKRAGVAPRTLFRAKQALGVRSRKRSGSGGWVWEVPGQDGRSIPGGTLGDVGDVEATTRETGQDQHCHAAAVGNVGAARYPQAPPEECQHRQDRQGDDDGDDATLLALVNAARRAAGRAPLPVLPPAPFAGRFPCAACGAEHVFAAGASPICHACLDGHARAAD